MWPPRQPLASSLNWLEELIPPSPLFSSLSISPSLPWQELLMLQKKKRSFWSGRRNNEQLSEDTSLKKKVFSKHKWCDSCFNYYCDPSRRTVGFFADASVFRQSVPRLERSYSFCSVYFFPVTRGLALPRCVWMLSALPGGLVLPRRVWIFSVAPSGPQTET